MKSTCYGSFFSVLTVLALIFMFTGCGDPAETPSSNDLSGTITISPNTGITTGTELTAYYSGSEGVSYQWKRDTINVGTNSTRYTPTVAGTYTVTVSAQGYNSKTSAAVTVNAPTSVPELSGTITISPNTNVTTGTELTAYYSGSEGVSYQWKSGDTNVGTNSTRYTPTVTGTYTVTVSAQGYNSKTSAIVEVSDPSLLYLSGTITISPDTGVSAGTELTAYYSGSEGVSYQWKQDNIDVGTNSTRYTPNEAGSYTVTVSAQGYNSKTSAAVTVTTNTSTPNSGQASFTITFEAIAENAPVIGGSIIMYRSPENNTQSQTAILTVSSPNDYTTIEWYYGDTLLNTTTPKQTSLTLDAADIRYNVEGTHNLTLWVVKDGRAYSRAIPFEVR